MSAVQSERTPWSLPKCREMSLSGHMKSDGMPGLPERVPLRTLSPCFRGTVTERIFCLACGASKTSFIRLTGVVRGRAGASCVPFRTYDSRAHAGQYSRSIAPRGTCPSYLRRRSSRRRNRSLDARSGYGSWKPQSQSRSRVLYPRSGLASGKPRVLQSSLRRQEQLRVEQGRTYARDSQRRGRFNSEVVNAHSGGRSRHSDVDHVQRDSLTNLSGLLGMTPADVRQTDIGHNLRPSVRVSRAPRLSEAAAQRQKKLRIEQGRRYAAQNNPSVRRGLVSVGEIQKGERIRKRRERFWRELDWGCGAN